MNRPLIRSGWVWEAGGVVVRGWVSLVGVLVLALLTACGGGGAPPKELSVEEIPAAIRQVFAGSGAELEEAAKVVAEGLEGQEKTKAYLQLQTLLERPELSAEQRDVVSRSLMTVAALVNQAGQEGDQSAAEAVQIHRSMK